MKLPWLDPDERREVVERLIRFGLLRWSNKRDLPLKMGGTTDIYVNLRDARNVPEAIRFLSHLYAHPLRRLNPARFVEVPDSVSCFAGSLAVETGIPYLTIREAAKEGRVAKAKFIGNAMRGERVVILDDVITNGDSKVEPYLECRRMGLNPSHLLVLVDRQQGWRENFLLRGVNAEVWPGMTLHDVRRYLVECDAMLRCEPEVEMMNPIIVALDNKSWEEVLPILDKLRTVGCTWKVNDLVFNEGIKNLVPELQTYGRVMVDLKAHDIPNTVGNTCRHLRPHQPWAVTVHASGGGDMVAAAVKALEGTSTLVLAITVLTSFDDKTCEEVYVRRTKEEVLQLAAIADGAGAHGLVCSAEELEFLKPLYPDKTFVVPGVRSPGEDKGDQKRVATPAEATAKGATRVVMGRQILGKTDPAAEVKRVLADEIHAC